MQYARLTANPKVNSRAHTVLPAEASEIPSSSAALTTFLPKATATLGRHESIPARIAMVNPTVKALDFIAFDKPPEGALRAPPTEDNTMPKTTSAVPARRSSPVRV